MKLKIHLFFVLFVITNCNAQVNKNDCVNNMSKKSRLFTNYTIYNINQINFDTLSIDMKGINDLKKIFKNPKIVKSISNIKSNPIFVDMVKNYAGLIDGDGINLEIYAKKYKGSDQYKIYLKNFIQIDSIANRILNYEDNNILSLSIFTLFEDYGDCYLYNSSYKGKFDNVTVTNSSMVMSVLKDFYYESIEYTTYEESLVGIQLYGMSEMICIPIVSDGKYICDIFITLCKGES